VLQKTKILQNRIAHNGRLFATLPEPIKRARAQAIRGFAGEGNVAEVERANASAARPKPHLGFKRRSAKQAC
jgi:hypothetical protein